MPYQSTNPPDASGVLTLRSKLLLAAPDEQAAALADASPAVRAAALRTFPPAVASDCLTRLAPDTGARTPGGTEARPNFRTPIPAGSAAEFPEQTVGRMMRFPLGVVPEEATAGAVTDLVRRIASAELTYLYAIDLEGRLTGVVVLRDLFLAPPHQAIREFMVRPPFFLTPDMTVLDAMRAVVGRHFPVYPVCRADGTLLGLVRGYALFEKQVITITAQAGKMVGVRAQEHPDTPFLTSLRLRLPWLSLNLALSLGSAIIVFFFKATLAQFIILAVFLPVIATQGRNSGAQTMAITLRGLTSGEWPDGRGRVVLAKECLLGLASGSVIGLICAVTIWIEEVLLGQPAAAMHLATAVFAGIATGCVVSCATGVAVPLALRRLGYDPALAAGILQSNVSTVICQALFLSLAWCLVV